MACKEKLQTEISTVTCMFTGISELEKHLCDDSYFYIYLNPYKRGGGRPTHVATQTYVKNKHLLAALLTIWFWDDKSTENPLQSLTHPSLQMSKTAETQTAQNFYREILNSSCDTILLFFVCDTSDVCI